MNNFSTKNLIAVASDSNINFNKADLQRFVSKIVFTQDCWVWTDKPDNGYGRFWLNRKSELAHRFAYLIWAGPIPSDKQLDHLCRNRGCVNPEHLEPVSIAENVLRGEGLSAKNARKTHCKMGHELAGNNLHLLKRGGRVCKKCQLVRLQKWQRGKIND